MRGEAGEVGRGRRSVAGMEELRLHPEGEEMVSTPSPLPQLKPGTPLPSPEDLRGKILIKNKKNQFSGPASPSKEPDGEAEGSFPPIAPVAGDTGESAWQKWGWDGVGVREHLEQERGAGPARDVLGSQPGVGVPPPPVLMELCMAVWAGDEVAKQEEEEVEDEEEEESGNLDEEEIKKMQSDEVCGDSWRPFCHLHGRALRAGYGATSLGSVLPYPPPSSLP